MTFVIGGGERPETVENVEAEVRLPDGSRWSATIFTVAEVQCLLTRWAGTGKYGRGSYFCYSDSLIVRDPGVTGLTRALAELHRNDELRPAPHRLDEADE
ncbi:hypothetical protein [Amycolatopsis sp. FDAARGOS 1241]|uniref:hypothetical protein n=1 Tax=Amycolatopsis sp. FDAARGOS 1241 TaxID=2778070 RepID=UPI00195191D8|nr:hypothetical protein [Amycolatopsis sp. FDAARGOS 1241]QRP43418.1 hypothetical protein I6J71_28885 [Amycolatopsis sp. FDAARGOS 1241]